MLGLRTVAIGVGWLRENLQKVIKGCDYAVGNLEGVTNEVGKEPRPMMQDASTISSLKDAGFNLLLLANNHVADYGHERLQGTMNEIKENGLDYIGAGFSYEEAYTPIIIELNNIKIGLINICEASVGQWDLSCTDYGFAWIGDINLSIRITSLKKKVDFIIACAHAGLEHESLPLPYFRNYYHSLCDLGVDCVVGAHPHIVQGVERYSDSLIFYSLGNFFFPRKQDSGTDDIENSAFSCVLSFEKGKSIDYKLVHHSVNNLKVEVDETPRWDVMSLTQCLEPSRYEVESGILLKKAYQRHVRPQLVDSLMGTEITDPIIKKIKFTLKYFFKDYKKYQAMRDKLLRRLIVNETYRSIIDSETKYSINNKYNGSD